MPEGELVGFTSSGADAVEIGPSGTRGRRFVRGVRGWPVFVSVLVAGTGALWICPTAVYPPGVPGRHVAEADDWRASSSFTWTGNMVDISGWIKAGELKVEDDLLREMCFIGCNQDVLCRGMFHIYSTAVFKGKCVHLRTSSSDVEAGVGHRGGRPYALLIDEMFYSGLMKYGTVEFDIAPDGSNNCRPECIKNPRCVGIFVMSHQHVPHKVDDRCVFFMSASGAHISPTVNISMIDPSSDAVAGLDGKAKAIASMRCLGPVLGEPENGNPEESLRCVRRNQWTDHTAGGDYVGQKFRKVANVSGCIVACQQDELCTLFNFVQAKKSSLCYMFAESASSAERRVRIHSTGWYTALKWDHCDPQIFSSSTAAPDAVAGADLDAKEIAFTRCLGPVGEDNATDGSPGDLLLSVIQGSLTYHSHEGPDGAEYVGKRRVRAANLSGCSRSCQGDDLCTMFNFFSGIDVKDNRCLLFAESALNVKHRKRLLVRSSRWFTARKWGNL